MLFNSFSFLVFFPLVTLLFFVIPQRARYLWLLAASYFFYMCWNARYLLLLALSTLITYASGLLIQRRCLGRRRLWVALSVGSNLGILFFFKYFNFALTTLAGAAARLHIQLNLPAWDILLPVGISFYTFQALSYTLDVYRGEVQAERNLAKYALFVSFFPQLVAGPIERSKNLLHQVSQEHHFEYERVRDGLVLMLWGYFEKLVIADRAALLVDQVYNNYTEYAGLELILATVLFAIQIYCDFGGYSHIAIGAAQVMGFRLMDNFRQPYLAVSIGDFWSRWHISLSSWLQDYLFTPLVWSKWTQRLPIVGKRVQKPPALSSLMITFLASGLWHGAAWHYVLWGGLNGLYQVASSLTRKPRKKLWKALRCNTKGRGYRLWQRAVTFFWVCLGYVFFRARGGADALIILRRMTIPNPWVLVDGVSLYQMGLSCPQFWLLLAMIALLVWVDLRHEQGAHLRQALAARSPLTYGAVCLAGLMTVLIFGVWGPMFDAGAFIYFQF